jgi:hypothetical protein
MSKKVCKGRKKIIDEPLNNLKRYAKDNSLSRASKDGFHLELKDLQL